MSHLFFQSDHHFNHAFVAGTRGFATAEEHDEALIDAINSTVTKRDHLWFLGDVFFGNITKGLEKVDRIHAVKHLVLGNHDAAHPLHQKSHTRLRQFLGTFETVHLHEQLILRGHKVLLSHFPVSGDHYDSDRFEAWRIRPTNKPLIHGHVHQAFHTKDRGINVGVDFHFKPASTDEIVTWIEGLPPVG